MPARKRKRRERTHTQLLRHQQLNVVVPRLPPPRPPESPLVLSRAQRAHCRLSWEQRLARNACEPPPAPTTLTLYGIPDHFAAFLGLKAA